MKKYFPWFFLIFGIFFSTLIWPYLTIPYDQTNTIIGEYSSKKINPLNDTLRGLFFIFFPLLSYSLSLIVFDNQNLSKKIFNNNYNSRNNNNINYLCVLLIIFCFLEFLSLDYKNFLGSLDSIHEGTFLSAQLNFQLKNKFWSGTFYDYGFLGNNIGIFFSYLFNDYTIGIQRFSFKFLILFNKILLLLICRKIIVSINLNKNAELLYLIFSLSTLTLVSFYDHVTPFHDRIFLFLLFTLIVFNIVSVEKKNNLNNLIISFFSIISLLFYWDIGTYINVLLIVFLIYLFLVKRKKDAYQIALGIISSWLLFYIFIPKNEFKEFINQYFVIINISDYLLGIEFPQPFSDKSTRHTKALLLIIISGTFLINFILKDKNIENLKSKFYLLFIFISAIIFFKSGLMRSDGPHIKYTSGLYTMLIFFFISYNLIYLFNNFKFLNKVNYYFQKKTFLSIISIFIFFLFLFQNNFENLLNIFNPKKNFFMITKIKDNKFLDNDYYEFLKLYKDIIKDENCVQQFTDDSAIPYLLNKPTCTKYYTHAHIIQNWTENNFIKELKKASPNYIVYSSRINWFKDRNNAPNADKYILDNYSLYKDLTPWQIYKKNSF